MKRYKQGARCLAVAVLLPAVLLLSSCRSGSRETVKPTYQATEMEMLPESGTVAENGRYVLLWDMAKQCVLLKSKSSGQVWSTIPYEYYQQENTEGFAKVSMESALRLDYVEPDSGLVKTNQSFAGVQLNGNLTCRKIENGVEIVYDFMELEISVPVQYLLREDSLLVRIPVSRIGENQNRVYQIALVPYLTAVKNNTANGYLFVPSGSGALIETDEGKRGIRTFSSEVYGLDPSLAVRKQPENENAVRLPVFGAKAGNQALLGVIESGAEHALIEAQAGNEEIGFSQVGATFRLRGMSNNAAKFMKFTDYLVEEEYVSVGYYPLEGDKATYTGMANRYSAYLTETGRLSADKTAATADPLYLEILGGALTRNFFLGIPYAAVSPATTFAQAQSMLQELVPQLSLTPLVNMAGTGDSGLDAGRICGGFSFNRQLGGQKGFAALRRYCLEKRVPLVCEYDLLTFKKSGNGYSTYRNAALCVNGLLSYNYNFSLTDGKREDTPRSVMLRRSELTRVARELSAFAGRQEMVGLSLPSLGSVAYSDYRDGETRYTAKGAMAADVQAAMETLRQGGQTLLVKDANDYAATAADYLAGIPTSSGKYDAFDQDVPFYATVFQGYKTQYVAPINLAADPRGAFLKAMETGSGLSFSLAASTAAEYTMDTHEEIYCSQYAGVKDTLLSMVQESRDLYSQTAGARITAHDMVAAGVYRTRFDNHTAVYVNYTQQPVTVAAVTVPARGFVCVAEKG